MENGFDYERPLSSFTAGEFIEMLEKHFGTPTRRNKYSSMPEAPKKLMLYGIKGIEDYFGVSHRTAQALKDGVLKPAVSQNGRIIITDAEYALQLFNQKKASKNA